MDIKKIITEIQRLELNPADTLIIKVKVDKNKNAGQYMKQVEQYFQKELNIKNKIMVVPSDTTFQILDHGKVAADPFESTLEDIPDVKVPGKGDELEHFID